MTQYERIKNRSIEEVATGLDKIAGIVCSNYFCKDCPLNFIGGDYKCSKEGFIEWLESEVEDDG